AGAARGAADRSLAAWRGRARRGGPSGGPALRPLREDGGAPAPPAGGSRGPPRTPLSVGDGGLRGGARRTRRSRRDGRRWRWHRAGRAGAAGRRCAAAAAGSAATTDTGGGRRPHLLATPAEHRGGPAAAVGAGLRDGGS